MKKENKHINIIFECTIKEIQWNNYSEFIINL